MANRCAEKWWTLIAPATSEEKKKRNESRTRVSLPPDPQDVQREKNSSRLPRLMLFRRSAEASSRRSSSAARRRRAWESGALYMFEKWKEARDLELTWS